MKFRLSILFLLVSGLMFAQLPHDKCSFPVTSIDSSELVQFINNVSNVTPSTCYEDENGVNYQCQADGSYLGSDASTYSDLTALNLAVNGLKISNACISEGIDIDTICGQLFQDTILICISRGDTVSRDTIRIPENPNCDNVFAVTNGGTIRALNDPIYWYTNAPSGSVVTYFAPLGTGAAQNTNPYFVDNTSPYALTVQNAPVNLDGRWTVRIELPDGTICEAVYLVTVAPYCKSFRVPEDEPSAFLPPSQASSTICQVCTVGGYVPNIGQYEGSGLTKQDWIDDLKALAISVRNDINCDDCWDFVYEDVGSGTLDEPDWVLTTCPNPVTNIHAQYFSEKPLDCEGCETGGGGGAGDGNTSIASIAVTGTTTKTITITESDGSVTTATFTDLTGTGGGSFSCTDLNLCSWTDSDTTGMKGFVESCIASAMMGGGGGTDTDEQVLTSDVSTINLSAGASGGGGTIPQNYIRDVVLNLSDSTLNFFAFGNAFNHIIDLTPILCNDCGNGGGGGTSLNGFFDAANENGNIAVFEPNFTSNSTWRFNSNNWFLNGLDTWNAGAQTINFTGVNVANFLSGGQVQIGTISPVGSLQLSTPQSSIGATPVNGVLTSTNTFGVVEYQNVFQGGYNGVQGGTSIYPYPMPTSPPPNDGQKYVPVWQNGAVTWQVFPH